MFSYKFIVSPKGKLSVQLICNCKKSQVSCRIDTTKDQLALAQYPKRRTEDIAITSLRSALREFESYLEFLQAKMPRIGMPKVDVKEIGEDFAEHFGLIKKRKVDNTGTFVKHYEQFMESKTNRGTRGVYKHTLDRIRAFDKNVDNKMFEDIDLKWLTDFEAFCAKTACKNARNIHLRNIRAVFNNAIDYGITTVYPFRRFKIRPEATRKRSMAVEELRRLFDYPVEDYAEIYRDMFRLIFMLVGINSVDLHGLKSITRDGRIEYKRAKTGRLYSIKVEPEAMEIINKYRGVKGLLCIADRWIDSRNFRHQCNKALQKIGQVERKGRGGKKTITAEFEGVTTYWARHTWATIAASLDIPKDTIAAALGHGGDTVTDIYIDFDQKKVDAANRRVLDWVLYGKR